LVVRLKAVSGPRPSTTTALHNRRAQGAAWGYGIHTACGTVQQLLARPEPKKGRFGDVAQNHSQSTSGRTTPFSSYGPGYVPATSPRFSSSFCLPGIVSFGRTSCALSNDKCQALWHSSGADESERSLNGRIDSRRAKPRPVPRGSLRSHWRYPRPAPLFSPSLLPPRDRSAELQSGRPRRRF